MMTATGLEESIAWPAIQPLAVDLSGRTWTLPFTSRVDQLPRTWLVSAREVACAAAEIRRAKPRLGLPAGALVVGCEEGGRGGLWLHRRLEARLNKRPLECHPV
jgi:hypothetical protein